MRSRTWISVLAALSTGCAAGPSAPDPSSLRTLFPAHAGVITEGPSPALGSSGFDLATGAIRAGLPHHAEDPVRIETAGGFAFLVREPGATGPGRADGAAVAYGRARGGTSWWRAAGDVVEEWILLPSGAAGAAPAAAWEIEGGTPRAAGSWVEIGDDAGVARVRVAAPLAQAASGLPLQARLLATGSRIELFVDGAPPGEPVLIDPAWSPTSSMSTAREGHTATLLPDGRVLIAGGLGTQVEPTAEIYDPGTFTFSLTGSMSDARVNHYAVLLATGKVLVAGGDSLASAELYDPTAGTWSGAAPLSVARTRAAGALLADGRVLLAGGDGTVDADLYDPVADTWTPTPMLATPRRSHSATRIPGGQVLIAGGATPVGAGEATTSTVEIFDPGTGTWTGGAPLIQGRAQHTATALADGRVLVAGGTSVPGTDSLTELASTEAYDPASGTWQGLPPLGTPRAEHTATLLSSGAVLVAGGLDTSNSALRSAELYDPSAPRQPWVAVAPMNRDRIAHTATALVDGSVLIAGGEQQSSAELFENGQIGDRCTGDLACATGHCAQGVCCATACDLPCHGCALAGSAGTCTEAPAGSDPRGDCGDGGACDLTCGGGAACVSRAGTQCTAGGCTADGQGQFAGAVCAEGLRDCPIAVVACSVGYRCDEDAGACRADCRSRADCASDYACDPSHRCVQAAEITGASAPSCAHRRLRGAELIPADPWAWTEALLAGSVAVVALLARARRRARRGRSAT
jgi:hypothetical protein